MCGVIGFLRRSDVEQKFDVDVGLAALSHRGPDDRGSYQSDAGSWRCTLGHVRLSIIDLSPLGHQPMASAEGRFHITFNGEIFNFASIRSKLEAEGVRFKSNSDTEVILEGYARWGARIVEELRGMFAFAIWDAREASLFLARDRMGIKPLYVVGDGACTFGFSSEIRALLATGLSSREISPEGVATYLSAGSCEEPLTILRDVRMLPPGTYALVKDGVVTHHAYWRPVFESQVQTYEEAVEVVRPVLREAIELRLVADVPIGVFLSGGIDSSVVAGIAAKRATEPLHTFNVGFRERDHDESDFASEFSRAIGCRHHALLLESSEAVRRIEEAARAQDQPSADGINTFFVAEAVRKTGITVALSGLGGDEVFAGYRNFRYFEAAKWFAGARPLAAVTTAIANRLPVPSWSRKVSKVTDLLTSAPTGVGAYTTLRAMFDKAQIVELLGAPPLRTVHASGADARFDLLQGDAVAEFSALELRNYLKNTLLRDADVMSMAHGLEVRVPLLDHVLVETVLPLQGRFKLDAMARRNKPLLCDAGQLVSASLSRRRKMGFTLPFDRWFAGPLQPYVASIIDTLRPGGLLRREAVDGVWQSFRSGRLNAWRVWCLVSLISWCENHGVAL